MVKIPHIKIPSVRVGGIDPTSDIGTAIGGVLPTPITYLTQWKIIGNSEVHTDPYLTQWKVEGNSVVDNNTILSCGDLGQDGYYHVKISNGVNIYDIALDEPLRKVGSVADKIEFANGVATLTRNLGAVNLGNYTFNYLATGVTGKYRMQSRAGIADAKVPERAVNANILCALYNGISVANTYSANVNGVAIHTNGVIIIYDANYNAQTDVTAFNQHIQGVELVYELATVTTEIIDVSPFPVSSTDTYTSANVVPYSAFEHTEHKEIWSCGEYSETDNKYHIVVLPLGKSPVDIALTEPLRKVNDVADTIEFPTETEGKALVTRNIKEYTYNTIEVSTISGNKIGALKRGSAPTPIRYVDTGTPPIIAAKMLTLPYATALNYNGVAISLYGQSFYIRNANIEQTTEAYQDYFDNELVPLTIAYQLATPTTELVDAPQIAEAESYTCVISQGGKAVEWSSFTTESNS